MNDFLEKGVFPDELRLVDAPPFYEKCQDKGNFRLDIFLFHMLKVFERILYKQVNDSMTLFTKFSIKFFNKIMIFLLKERKF